MCPSGGSSALAVFDRNVRRGMVVSPMLQKEFLSRPSNALPKIQPWRGFPPIRFYHPFATAWAEPIPSWHIAAPHAPAAPGGGDAAAESVGRLGRVRAFTTVVWVSRTLVSLALGRIEVTLDDGVETRGPR